MVVEKLPHHWLFEPVENLFFPYFVSAVVFHPAQGSGQNYRAPYVQITLEYYERGKQHTIHRNIVQKDIKGRITVSQALEFLGLVRETAGLVKNQEAEVAKYNEHAPKTGEQYLAHGFGHDASGSWHGNRISFEKDGVFAKVVMDDVETEGRRGSDDASSPLVSAAFWNPKESDDDDSEADDKDMVVAPLHPTVKVFHLGEHVFATTHISNLEAYVYDEKLGAKLVLPVDHRELIDTLTGNAIRRMSDIIKGKATGIIILCSGAPGTGKTLTAEVYSEVAKRPLYMVQCSQLGTDEVKIEQTLQTVLARAVRWRAILLIDEADVYVHERGDNLEQNAIVGVFLRLLEYFSGIMFLTTNRATIVDDAIISRVTAHVRFEVPKDLDDKTELWNILTAQYGLLGQLDVLECAKAFPDISGRSIRQLIRLAKFMADRRKEKVTLKMLQWAAKYHDFTERS